MAPLGEPNVDIVQNEDIQDWILQEVYSGEYPEQDPLMAHVNADNANDYHEMELGDDLIG